MRQTVAGELRTVLEEQERGLCQSGPASLQGPRGIGDTDSGSHARGLRGLFLQPLCPGKQGASHWLEQLRGEGAGRGKGEPSFRSKGHVRPH